MKPKIGLFSSLPYLPIILGIKKYRKQTCMKGKSIQILIIDLNRVSQVYSGLIWAWSLYFDMQLDG